MNIIISTLLSLAAPRANMINLQLPALMTHHALDHAINTALQQRFGEDVTSEPERLTLLADIEQFLNTFDFDIQVPGSHGRGLSNQQMLEIFSANGRDFAEPTDAMMAEIRKELISKTEGKPLDYNTIVDIAANTIRNWIVGRVKGDIRDVSLAPLTADWLQKKRRRGWSLEVGQARGRWLKSLGKARILIK